MYVFKQQEHELCTQLSLKEQKHWSKLALMSRDSRFVDIKAITIQKLQMREKYRESCPIDIFMSRVLLCCDCCTRIHCYRYTLTLASRSASMMPPVCSCRRAYALWRAWYSFVNCRNLSSDSSAAKLLRLRKKAPKELCYVQVACSMWNINICPLFTRSKMLFNSLLDFVFSSEVYIWAQIL